MNEPGEKILLHVGYAKAASSFLGSWFEANPYFTIDGEPGTPGKAGYEYRVVRDMSFATPRYENNSFDAIKEIKSYQQSVCTRLALQYPHAHVLIVTRGYKSMLSSSYSQYLREGGAWSAEKIGLYIHEIKELFDYSYLINIYRNAFGYSKVIVLPFEFLKEDTVQFIVTLENLLGLPHVNCIPGVINRSLTRKEAQYRLAVNKVFYGISENTGPLGKILKNWYIQKITSRKSRKSSSVHRPLDASFQHPLIDVPDELLSKMKENSRELAGDPVFRSYLSYY